MNPGDKALIIEMAQTLKTFEEARADLSSDGLAEAQDQIRQNVNPDFSIVEFAGELAQIRFHLGNLIGGIPEILRRLEEIAASNRQSIAAGKLSLPCHLPDGVFDFWARDHAQEIEQKMMGSGKWEKVGNGFNLSAGFLEVVKDGREGTG